MKTATLIGPLIELRFPYDAALIAAIKARVYGRKWNPELRAWTAPAVQSTVPVLIDLGFQVDKALLRPAEQAERPPLDLPKGLYPFQREGVQFVEDHGGRALIGDEMGTGKTIQALAWLRLHPELRPALVIAPATLKINWERKAREWIPGCKVRTLYGRQTEQDVLGYDGITILNYDLLIMKMKDGEQTLAEFMAQRAAPRAIVIDECHYVSNQKAQRTKAVKRIVRRADKVVALSGTPITSRPAQFFPILNMLCPTAFPSFWQFAQRYCDMRHNGFGWNVNGSSNVEELHQILTETVMIRRLKKDVLKDLPEKIFNVVPLEIDNRDTYARVEADYVRWLTDQGQLDKAEKAGRAEQLAKTEALKRVATEGKMAAVTGWIADFLEDSNEKLIVFTHHVDVRKRLHAAFDGKDHPVALGEGGDSNQLAEDMFQNDPRCRLFVGGLECASEGITLTAASNVAMVELPWTPGKLKQASDRAHRIGQKECVNVHMLIAEKTIEEDIAEILDRKSTVLSGVLDGTAAEEGSLITELMERWRNRR